MRGANLAISVRNWASAESTMNRLKFTVPASLISVTDLNLAVLPCEWSAIARLPENREQHLFTSQLRKLPVEERNAVLADQATIAVPIYHSDKRLTDFEAFPSQRGF